MLEKVAVLAIALATGCAVTSPGASDANLARAKSRTAQGATLFDAACSSCHGPRGEGLAGAPSIIGVTGLPRYPRDQSGVKLYQDPNQVQRQNQERVPGAASRAEFVTAADLYDYLRQHAKGIKQPSATAQAGAPSLTEEESWALVNFMLVAHGSAVPDQEISAANARDVLIRTP
jgi:Cytochrome c